MSKGRSVSQAGDTAQAGRTASSTSSSVRAVAGKGGGKTRKRSAAKVEQRISRGIAKRWEQQLQTPNQEEQEVPSFGSAPSPTNLHQYYQAQSEAASSSSGHSNYARFLAPEARLKRPLSPPRGSVEGDGVYQRVWKRFQRELPGVTAEVERTPGQAARRSYLCGEARRAVSATLGAGQRQSRETRVEKSEESESSSSDTNKGLEPSSGERRQTQPGAVTECAESAWESRAATTRYSSSGKATTRYSSSVASSKPPTVGYSAARTPSWYQHDTARK